MQNLDHRYQKKKKKYIASLVTLIKLRCLHKDLFSANEGTKFKKNGK